MEFRRVIFILIALLLSSIIHAKNNNLGIAFIHGTQDHRADAYGDYWKVDFIASVTSALPNPDNYFVVHCDFNQYMWDAAAGDCVAGQLADFIQEKNLSSLTLFTHSNGANVIRWVVSNPTYDSSYMIVRQKTNKIIAITPSSGGTELADEVLNGGIFHTGVGWLLGYLGNAIKQQRVADMRIFNEELLLGTHGRPSIPIPFQSIVGTDVVASPFSASSYCNGYLYNSSLKITKLYLDKCSDGFLSCASQAAAGQVWFYDKEKTYKKQPLSHNQSRHSCSGLDQILISALPLKGDIP